nr:mechanosensitive ion channel family protein [Pseudenhygromyxa sp. WMMC2535]
MFGSIVIFVDRPFQVGDWVEIGEHEGTIEEVGLRVTRIRTFANSLITIPNSTLTTTAINNWSRMQKRRIKLTIGVTYDATPDQLKAAVDGILEALHGDRRIAQDFMLVNFTNFGASSLEIFVYCFTLTTRWDEYMQIREEVLFEFMRRLHDLGLSFAFPSQSLYIESMPPGRPQAAWTRCTGSGSGRRSSGRGRGAGA